MSCSERDIDPNPDCGCALDRLLAVLAQTREFIAGLDEDAAYTTNQGAWQGGTIGGHVRHCWDHVRSLVEGLTTGVIDYDNRERGTDVEHHRQAALFQLDGFIANLERARSLPMTHSVSVRAMLAADDDAANLTSTVGREIAFVLSHTIHHQAIMAMTAAELGQPVPQGFGYAPSTTAFLNAALDGPLDSALDEKDRSCAP